MNYAITQTSGKQLVVKPGRWYDIDLISQGNIGDFTYLNKVLLVRNEDKIQVGRPFLSQSRISAKLIQQVKGRKITVLKTKPKKKYTRVQGHRPKYSRIQIDELN
jgi:large subunit ribosomal protein L21